MGKINWAKVWETFMNNVGLIMLAVALLLLVFTPLLRYDNRDFTFTFNITGVDTNNTLSNSTIISLGMDCIKACNNKFYDTYSKLDLCYDQCIKVMGCENGNTI